METLFWLPTAMVSVPTLMFVLEGWLGVLPARRPLFGDAPPFVVLVPAHDEAAGIVATVNAVRNQLRACDHLLIVADNCADNTAALASSAGAEVIKRFDSERRGKGYALAAGQDALRDRPHEVVIVLDADCHPEPEALPRIASEAWRSGSVVQAQNSLVADGATPLVQLSSFAFLVKNLIRQRALQRLGAPVHLQGTGMAFPSSLFMAASLASADLAEDFTLGLELALGGQRVRFCEFASVRSAASSQAATVSQRTRWEHGSIMSAWRQAPRMARAVARGRVDLMPLLLDLVIPPLALLVLLIATTLASAAAFAAITGETGPLEWMAGLTMLFASTVGLAWLVVGRHHLNAATLLRVPLYVAWKLPIYLRLVMGRQRAWVRTAREAGRP